MHRINLHNIETKYAEKSAHAPNFNETEDRTGIQRRWQTWVNLEAHN